jgi:hypothetical protein
MDQQIATVMASTMADEVKERIVKEILASNERQYGTYVGAVDKSRTDWKDILLTGFQWGLGILTLLYGGVAK